MTSIQISPMQLQNAYRIAVQSSLTTFYRKSAEEAKRLVDSWWRRMSTSDDIESGMYLHSEALATAADLAHASHIEITDDVRQQYRQIIKDSTEAATAGTGKQAGSVKRTVTSKQMAG